MNKIIVILTAISLIFTACGNTDNTRNTNDDLDYRDNMTSPEYQTGTTPGQQLDTAIDNSREALNTAKRRTENVGTDFKEGVQEAGRDIKEGARDVKNEVKDATREAKDKAQKDKEVIDRKAREAREEMKNN